jgi:hypothetical protein
MLLACTVALHGVYIHNNKVLNSCYCVFLLFFSLSFLFFFNSEIDKTASLRRLKPPYLVSADASSSYIIGMMDVESCGKKMIYYARVPSRVREITIWTNNFNFFYSREGKSFCSGRV